MSETTCKYTSQYDGTTRCSERVHDLGFCAFHREAVDRGEVHRFFENRLPGSSAFLGDHRIQNSTIVRIDKNDRIYNY